MPEASRLTDREYQNNLEHLRDNKEQTRALYEGAKQNVSLIMQDQQKNRKFEPLDATLSRAKDIEEFYLQLYTAALHDFNRYVQDNQPPETGQKVATAE
jgi:hypothetical protein